VLLKKCLRYTCNFHLFAMCYLNKTVQSYVLCKNPILFQMTLHKCFYEKQCGLKWSNIPYCSVKSMPSTLWYRAAKSGRTVLLWTIQWPIEVSSLDWAGSMVEGDGMWPVPSDIHIPALINIQYTWHYTVWPGANPSQLYWHRLACITDIPFHW
jgi:hypothetical protein